MALLTAPVLLLIIVGLMLAIAAAVVDKLVPDMLKASAGGGGSDSGTADLSGGPKSIIDTQVVPLAKKHNMKSGVSIGAIEAANARHGPTASGGRSDHQGPPDKAWASDMSGSQADMHALAKDLAQAFGFSKSTGLQSKSKGGFRFQMIWQAAGHYDHVHFGVKR